VTKSDAAASEPSRDRALPSVLIIADNQSDARAARDAVRASGCRLVDSVEIAAAPARLARQISIDAVLFECPQTAPEIINPLLDRVLDLASRRTPFSLVSTNLGGVDALSSWLNHDAVTLLCAPTIADRVVALELGTAHRRAVLNDSAADAESMQLRHLADEVSRIAKALSSLTGPEFRDNRPGQYTGVKDMMIGFRAEPATALAAFASRETSELPNVVELRAAMRIRRMRDQYFAPDLFADPAWDMLLDLLAARLEQTQVAVSSLCIASAVPPTTALRWIKRMCDDDIFERVSDPDDGRRVFIRLSDTATEAMTRYWFAARRASGPII
jgi:hypothetical protein